MATRSKRGSVRESGPRRIRKSRRNLGVTILEVAHTAGVSTATVSRVLSDPSMVIEATRLRVERVIAKLNYSPNAAAKSLRTLESRKLLVIVPDIANPFFSVILQGIEEAAVREGYSVLIGDTQESAERDSHYARMLPRREVDGLIVLSRMVPSSIREWMASLRTIAPVVTGFFNGAEAGASTATIDNAAAAMEAAEYLYGLGHRRIGVVAGPAELPHVQERLRGVRLAAKQHGASAGLAVVHGRFAIEAGISGAAALLAQRKKPSAILGFSDGLATGVMEFARRNGLRVPAELSVMGFDDQPMSVYLMPPLSTVALPMHDVGRETVRLLLGILRGNIKRPETVLLPYRLVSRGSTAAFVG
jgi:LacI family transcriptional regulator, repressor for deo operon, udp, cdd, tsx, nupC, and nupG